MVKTTDYMQMNGTLDYLYDLCNNTYSMESVVEALVLVAMKSEEKTDDEDNKVFFKAVQKILKKAAKDIAAADMQ